MSYYKKPEILSPASTFNSVAAALNGGCDAIYIGGKSFNARQYADNPSDEELKEIIARCHLCGVKVFITLNILCKQCEISDAIGFVSKVYSYGADGLIVQDIGIFSVFKKYYPNIMKSASTQMTIHNSAGVSLAKKIGFDRVVLSRELSLDEIKNITAQKGDLQIEAFVHGALCVCYSGRCLMSSVIGQRSGNRGRCAQPCRMEYSLIKTDGSVVKKGFLLSPKDISAAEILDEIVSSGIDSLKIEGRMKSPEYVSCVTSFYRKYIDEAYDGKCRISEEDLRDLTQIFNRGGSSHTGYYHTYSGTDMMSKSPKSSGVQIGSVAAYDKKHKICTVSLTADVVGGDGIEIWTDGEHSGTNISQKAASGEKIKLHLDGSIKKGDRVFLSYDKRLADRLKNTCTAIKRQQDINVYFTACTGEKIILELPDYSIRIEGGNAEKAQNRPMSSDDIIKHIKKTGGTPFRFIVKRIAVGNDIYIPVSALNDIRRKACEELEHCIRSNGERESIKPVIETYRPKKADITGIAVLVNTPEQLNAAVESKPDRIYFCADTAKSADNAAAAAHENGIEFFAAMPYITRDCSFDTDRYFAEFDKTSIDGYLVRSYIDFNTSKRVAADYTLNVANALSVNAVKHIFNAESVTLSAELNVSELKQLAGIDTEVFAYGRLPVMMTQQCPVGLYCGKKDGGKFCSHCGRNEMYVLSDRKNEEFPVKTQCGQCFALIYNSVPVCAGGRISDVVSTGTGMLRLEFTYEDYDMTKRIIQEHKKACTGQNTDFSFVDKKTNGHLFRGVD